MLAEVVKTKAAFTDERGEIRNILEEPVSHAAIITSKKGSIRANHYHPEQIQHDYLISGSYELSLKDIKSGEEEKMIIVAGDMCTIKNNIAHAMRFLEDSVFITLTTGSRETEKFEEHTVKFKLI